MPPSSDFVWVNKSINSSSLSNCKSETHFEHIRSHAIVVGHKSSRLYRAVKRKPHNFTWIRRNADRFPRERSPILKSGPQHKICHARTLSPPRSDEINTGRDRQHPKPQASPHSSSSSLLRFTTREGRLNLDEQKSACSNPALRDCLGGIGDPFSSYAIELDAAALDQLWYFETIWSQCAFKIPGCVGYGQEPIPSSEITGMIRKCLTNEVHANCLLSAACARLRYLHGQEDRDGTVGVAHKYATRALRGLTQQLEAKTRNGSISTLSEDEATNILFLATYEMYSANEEGAAMHLLALRKLYGQSFTNMFVHRLQANLELLTEKGLAVTFVPMNIDHPY